MVNPFIKATLTGDTEVIQKLEGTMPKAVRGELLITVRRLAIELQRYVKQDKLSGQVLRNRTGTGRRSVYQRVDQTPNSVTGRVGTNVFYMKLHEGGFEGKRLITQAFGRQLKFPVWASIKLPKRSFLRSSLKDKSVHIKSELGMAVMRGMKV